MPGVHQSQDQSDLQAKSGCAISISGRRAGEARDGWLSSTTQMFHQELSEATFLRLLVHVGLSAGGLRGEGEGPHQDVQL